MLVSRRRDQTWTFLVLSLALLCMALYTGFVSRHRIFWGDEMFAWEMVTDPSWRHMLRAWNLGADGGGISFYVLCRFWLAVAGHSELAFRAFSALGVFAAFTAMWYLLRRFYRPLPAALSLFLVFTGSRLILWQLLQCRFYGLLLGASALAFYALAVRPTPPESKRNAKTLPLLFCSHFLLASTHPLGAGYSAALLGAYVLVDGLRKQPQYRSYLAVVASWSVLLFSRTAMQASAEVGKPWFWTTKPTLSDLRGFYEPSFAVPQPKILLLLLAVVLLWPVGRHRIAAGVKTRRDVLIPAFILLIVPVALWAVSQRSTSYFVDRYLIATTLGVVVFLAEVFEEILPARLSWPYLAILASSAVLFLSALRFALMYYPAHLHLPDFDFTGALVQQLPRGVPIVITNNDVFELMLRYQARPDLPFLYPIDWPLALDPRSPRDLVSSQNEMKNWRKSGYYADHIVDSDTLLQHASHLIIVQGDGVRWVQLRLLHNQQWRVTRLPDFSTHPHWHQEVWQADRVVRRSEARE